MAIFGKIWADDGIRSNPPFNKKLDYHYAIIDDCLSKFSRNLRFNNKKRFLLGFSFLILIGGAVFVFRSALIKALPKNFSDCIKIYENVYNPSLSLNCVWFVEKSDRRYPECVKRGGYVVSETCPPCPNCNCFPDGCKLIYYNPLIHLPINFEQCQAINTSINGTEKNLTCSLSIIKKGNYDKETMMRLFKECQDNGGLVTLEKCEYKVDKN